MSVSAILNGHRDGVGWRAREYESVLAIQDKTDLNYSSHPQTSGLGFINQTAQQGMKVHSCFVVSGTGTLLGVLYQYCWRRQQSKGKRQQQENGSNAARQRLQKGRIIAGCKG